MSTGQYAEVLGTLGGPRHTSREFSSVCRSAVGVGKATAEAGATCRGCPRRWTGLREAHCSACHEHFSSPFTFDAHRDRGRCIPPSRVKVGERCLKSVERAHGVCWVLDLDDVEFA